ncbi:MAG: cysteine desulfurase [Pirellulales bacterium]|nr:cysteine desulfurase [Pirellulales bacterium]
MPQPIYFDNHSTTRCDPRVVEAMLPYFTEEYGNAASTTHPFGWQAKEDVDAARASIAEAIGAKAKEIVFTSGATESNNLALRGVMMHPRQKRQGIVSVATEHPSILDPLENLARDGFDVKLIGVDQDGTPSSGVVRLDELEDAVDEQTALVSVMLANNEIGVIQPLSQIAEICRRHDVLLHCDATQAVGKIPVDVRALGVDVMSFSAHKFYGPKGVGALYFRRGGSPVRILAQLLGGGHESGLRSGTLNVPGIIGMARALELCHEEMEDENERLAGLRAHLWKGLADRVDGIAINGPTIDDLTLRLTGNLNLRFEYVDGEALLMSVQDLAMSSGSACTSAEPEPSHVLRALGLSEDDARSSIRIGLGRFNTREEVEIAIESLAEAVGRLRKLSSMTR